MESIEIKEACLALYARLAIDKECNIMIVLEADLIYDVLSLGSERALIKQWSG